MAGRSIVVAPAEKEIAINYTLSRPLHGRAILLDLDRDALTGHTTHPSGRAAEWAIHALLSVLRSCGNGNDPFARHNERGRLVDLAFPIQEAALLRRWRGIAGER